MSLYSARVTQFFQVGVHGVQSVVCAFSEVMASTGRAGPDRAFYSPGRADILITIMGRAG